MWVGVGDEPLGGGSQGWEVAEPPGGQGTSLGVIGAVPPLQG